jgi:hypothetical protein
MMIKQKLHLMDAVIQARSNRRIFPNDYHWVDTAAGGLLVPEGIIHPVVSVSITGWIPLLVDY